MKVQRKGDILTFLKAQRSKLQGYGVARIGLFGSFVHDRPTEASDIDFLVEFRPDRLTYDNYINLAYFLEDNLQRSVDLVTSDSLSPHLGPHILNEVENVPF